MQHERTAEQQPTVDEQGTVQREQSAEETDGGQTASTHHKSQAPSFEEQARQYKEHLRARRRELEDEHKRIDQEIERIDNELATLEAFEAARAGKAVTVQTGSKRASRRADILALLAERTGGLTKQEIIQELDAADDRKATNAVSNALNNLKRAGKIQQDSAGRYKLS